MDEEARASFETIEKRLEHIEDVCGDVHVENVGWMTAHEILLKVLIKKIASHSDDPTAEIRDIHYQCVTTIKRKLEYPDNDPVAQKRFIDAALQATERFFSHAYKI
jgi:hypothetical protein